MHAQQARARDYEQRHAQTARHYDYTWRKLRHAYLSQHPLCECDRCKSEGLVTPAEVVDHIVPINDDPSLRLEWSNLRSMSKRCHDAHTARTVGYGRRRAVKS
jgi:5-methylcytosine-specific restriction enzyme A